MVSLIKRTTVNVARAATTAAPMATLALLVAFGATRAVASIVVDPNTTPCVSATTHYTTIQAAVSAAASGATIQVCPANYAEQVTIAKPLTLKGVTNTTGNTGAAVVTIPNNTFSGAYTQIVINATGVTLTDIGVDGTNSLSSCSSASLTGIMFGLGIVGNPQGCRGQESQYQQRKRRLLWDWHPHLREWRNQCDHHRLERSQL